MSNTTIHNTGYIGSLTSADKVTNTHIYGNPTDPTKEATPLNSQNEEHLMRIPSESEEKGNASSLSPRTTCRQPNASSNEMVAKICEKCLEPEDFLYDMQKGYVQIINNVTFDNSTNLEKRNGSENDVDVLREFFEMEAGWCAVHSCHNMTAQQMREKIRELSERDYSREDVFVLIILSHGCEKGIYGVDGEILSIENDILSKFTAKVSQSLRDKPKIFVMQACRGDIDDEGHVAFKTDAKCVKPPIYTLIPEFSEYLVLYPTSPGFATIRHESLGTYYIQTLIEVFKHFHKSEHLVEMLLRVNFRMSSMMNRKESPSGDLITVKTMPCMDVRLKRKYYFHAGIVCRYQALKKRSEISE